MLVQTTASRATRTFHDYEGVGAAMDGEFVLAVELLSSDALTAAAPDLL